jgi:AraC-like DNA-binding protein
MPSTRDHEPEPSGHAEEELEPDSLVVELQSKRSEMMTIEIETIALGLFEERGFKEVTVEDIASAARISVRTFYRYFPSKEAEPFILR